VDDTHSVSCCLHPDEEQPETESLTSHRSSNFLLCAKVSVPQELFRGCSWLGKLPVFSVAVPSKQACVPHFTKDTQHDIHYASEQVTTQIHTYMMATSNLDTWQIIRERHHSYQTNLQSEATN
jgi:hypothetical protein